MLRSLIAGIRAATPGHAYALCLDDDVQLQPALLTALVRDMEEDSSLFMATGGWGWLQVGGNERAGADQCC